MRTRLTRYLAALQLSPWKTVGALKSLPAYIEAYATYQKLADPSGSWPLRASYPCLLDRTEEGGTASGQYFHQDLLVAQRIFSRAPRVHCDVGSRIDGFVAHVAAFRSVEYFDIRPVSGAARNMVFRTGNLLEPDSLPARACDSLSCLHVIEHVGLGRYGDPLMPEGWRRALESLTRMLQDNGILYLSVPIGPQRVEFNAHRVFAPETIVHAAAGLGLRLEHFSWVDDQGALHDPLPGNAVIPQEAKVCQVGCGIFELRLSNEPPGGKPKVQESPLVR